MRQRHLAKTLAEVLPEGHLAPTPRRRGLGIACRHPAVVEPLPLGVRNGLVARFSPTDWSGLRQPIEIVNVHIFAPHSWPYFPRRKRRGRQVRGLLEFLRSNPDTLRAVVGDFNATPLWPVYAQLRSLCVDGVAEYHPRPPRTWPNLSRFGLPGFLRIDHCFVSGLRVTALETIPLPGSDHFGLCVDLELAD